MNDKKQAKSLLLFTGMSLINVVTAFTASILLYDQFYGTDSSTFRSRRIAPAIGILQLLISSTIRRAVIRQETEGSDNLVQKSLFDLFAGLWCSVEIGLGVVVADIVRNPK